MASNEAWGGARAGKGIDFGPCAERRRAGGNAKRARERNRHSHDFLSLWGYELVSAAARSCECAQWAADEGEPVER